MSQIRAGVAITDITPPKGIELAGYPHSPRHNTGAHDALYAGCIYLENNGVRLALVTMDNCIYSRKYVQAVRERVFRSTGIPRENIAISSSHTHSAPWTSGRLDMEALKEGFQPDAGYIKLVEDRLTGIIEEASHTAFPAQVGVEKGHCGSEQGVGGNRRDRNGPSDPEVWVLGVKDLSGTIKGCMVKYALHPTVLHANNTLVSADYPCYIREHLSAAKPGCITLFAQGTSGNQSSRYFRTGQTFEEAARIGSVIGREAERVLDTMSYGDDLPLSVTSALMDITLRQLPDKQTAQAAEKAARDHFEKLKAAGAPYLEVWNAELKLFGAEDILGYVLVKEQGIPMDLLTDEIPPEIMVMGIGDARIVFLQGEVFVEYGLAIQAGSPYKKTFVVELANGGMPGYVYTRDSLETGGYETDTSMMSPETGEQMVKTALNLLGK